MKLPKPEFFHDIEQSTPEWHQLRCGLLTATDAAALLANGEGRKKALYRVACETITQTPGESYQNDYMRRGKQQEPEARAAFALIHGCDPKPVGFIRRGPIGCSPDSLLPKKRILEIKTQKAELLAETLFRDQFPTEHIAQTQWQLWCAEYDKTDLVIYCPRMPLFHKERGRDEAYIKRLAESVDRALQEIDVIVRRIRGYGNV